MEKKNIGMKVAIIILFLLVIGLVGYIVYDKILNSDDNTISNNSNNQDNNKENKVDIDFINSNYSVIADKLDKYKNLDGSYGYISYYYSNVMGIRLYLSADGKVRMIKDGNNDSKYITNIDNVVDVIEFAVSGDYTYYFLLADGSVYSYNLYQFNNNVYTATKENVSGVNRLIHYSYAPLENAGGSNLLVAILNNGNISILNQVAS